MGRFSAAAFLNPIRSNSRATPNRLAPVEIQIIGCGTLDVLTARNVSQTGIGIYVPHGFVGFNLDEEVEIVITLPRERSFLARGIIKHQTDSGDEECHFGVHFTKISREQRTKIRDYVRSLKLR